VCSLKKESFSKNNGQDDFGEWGRSGDKTIFDPLFHSPCKKKKPRIGKEEMGDWRENVKKNLS